MSTAMMDLLPPELRTLILNAAARSGRTGDTANLRLVCKEFDAVLKPIILRTLSLDISKLSILSCKRHPDPTALRTIGRYCDSLFVDLAVLRDDLEISALETCMGWSHIVDPGDGLRDRYTLNPLSFTGVDLRAKMDTILANCQQVERARLSLPLPIISRYSSPNTFVLANALAALASRPQEDAAKLRVLVLENLTPGSLWELYYNPLDHHNMRKVLEGLDHLVLSAVRHAVHHEARVSFPTTLWATIRMAESLKTLCLVGLDPLSEPPVSSLRLSRPGLASDCISEVEWQGTILLPPTFTYHHLTCLELRRIDLQSDFFPAAAESFGATLCELHLNKVCLKIGLAPGAPHLPKDRWVGFPEDDDQGVAHVVRKRFPVLRICRATRLSYDLYGVPEDLEQCLNLDLDDPCGLERGLDRRFVEVAMGLEQPQMKADVPCDAPSHATVDPSCKTKSPGRAFEPALKDMQPSDWDVAAYHDLVANPTSDWLDGLDGCVPNDMTNSIEVLRNLAEAMSRRLSMDVSRFEPHAADARFHVVYEGDLALGVAMGRLTTQRVEQNTSAANSHWFSFDHNREIALQVWGCNDDGGEPYDVAHHPAFRSSPASENQPAEDAWSSEDEYAEYFRYLGRSETPSDGEGDARATALHLGLDYP